MEILSDLQASSPEPEPVVAPAAPEIPKFMYNKNNEFLETEINFFITQLRTRAKQNGLDEDMLIPVKSSDIQICKYQPLLPTL